MIQINQCRIPITYSLEERMRLLEQKIRTTLRIKDPEQFTWQVHRRSIDARKKPEIAYVYTLWVQTEQEEKKVRRLKNPKVQLVKERNYPGNFIADIRNHTDRDSLANQNDSAGACSHKDSDIHANMGECIDTHSLESTMVKPPILTKLDNRIPPIIIGAGPAGLFAAYLLTECGCPPIVLDRGKPIAKRRADVDLFWRTGILDPNSNVLFGEGGAGTFSDGKLNTSDKDKTGRIAYVLETFAHFGAPGEIIYGQKPHIGTDVLAEVISSMRQYLEDKGCRFEFETTVNDLCAENGRLQQLLCTSKGTQRVFPVSNVVLAIGHSSRDTFQMLEQRGVPMEAKNFAVGFRVEHPQKMTDEALYGRENIGKLPAAPYKLTSNFPNGRSVYSFCMCPGGYVVNASSQAHQTVVNGMSYASRDGANANSAIVVSVTGKDFYRNQAAAGSDYRNAHTGNFLQQESREEVMRKSSAIVNPLAGMYYQMELEEAAYRLGGGAIPQQLYGDFRQRTDSHAYGDFESQTKGTRTFANLRGILSEEMEQAFLNGMEHFAHIIPGFDRTDAILSGVESRTSSPVRILRDEKLQSPMAQGLYPCGEGAGYAGGIVSAAVDGLRVAEAILKSHKSCSSV